MSLFIRSNSESSEGMQSSTSLASIRERCSSDSWSTHENADDRNEKIQRKQSESKINHQIPPTLYIST